MSNPTEAGAFQPSNPTPPQDLSGETLARWRANAEINIRRGFGGEPFLTSQDTVVLLDELERLARPVVEGDNQ